MLRYRGDSEDPLKWEEVGNLDTSGANLALHDGRIFVATWTGISGGFGLEQSPAEGLDLSTIPPFPGIFMSPPIPPGGLNSSHADQWVKVWNVLDYEPDLVIAFSYLVGDLTSFMGHLYWGTMHFPSSSFIIHELISQPDLLEAGCGEDQECSNRRDEAERNSERSTSVFRGKNFVTTPEIELLYGESSFPVFSPVSGWTTQQNTSSLEPLCGPSGFIEGAREKFQVNFYTWTFETYLNEAYLGTTDSGGGFPPVPPFVPGGDLYRFSDLGCAETITLDTFGIGGGFRTMVPDEDGIDNDDGLYFGITGRDNLLPEGGWKLLRFK